MKTRTRPKNGQKPSAAKKEPALPAFALTLALIVGAIGILFLSSYFLPQLKFIEDMRSGELARPLGGLAVDPELGGFFLLRLLLSIANIALVVWLLYAYVKDYLTLKTSFALGLVAFLFSFLLYALSSLPPVHLFFVPRAFIGVFAFIPLLFSAVGLVIFAKLSSE